MTLCLAQSLIDNNGQFIAQDQLRRYVRWYRDGYLSSTGNCFDIGGATRVALATWNEFFNKLPAGTDVLDPDAHMPCQARIDQALKRKVSDLLIDISNPFQSRDPVWSLHFLLSALFF